MIEINYDEDQRITKIHQATYVKRLVKKFKIQEEVKRNFHSADPNIKLLRRMSLSRDPREGLCLKFQIVN